MLVRLSSTYYQSMSNYMKDFLFRAHKSKKNQDTEGKAVDRTERECITSFQGDEGCEESKQGPSLGRSTSARVNHASKEAELSNF